MNFSDFYVDGRYLGLTPEARREALQKVFDAVMRLDDDSLLYLLECADFWDELDTIESDDGFGTEGMRL